MHLTPEATHKQIKTLEAMKKFKAESAKLRADIARIRAGHKLAELSQP